MKYLDVDIVEKNLKLKKEQRFMKMYTVNKRNLNITTANVHITKNI